MDTHYNMSMKVTGLEELSELRTEIWKKAEELSGLCLNMECLVSKLTLQGTLARTNVETHENT